MRHISCKCTKFLPIDPALITMSHAEPVLYVLTDKDSNWLFLCSENYDRMKDWGSQPTKQCLYSYKGAAYLGLQATDFEEKDRDFAQQHLRILSGMYGLLRPMDMIQPYRWVDAATVFDLMEAREVCEMM